MERMKLGLRIINKSEKPFKERVFDISKSLFTEDGIEKARDRGRLVLMPVTDKNGHKTKRWMSPEDAEKLNAEAKKPEKNARIGLRTGRENSGGYGMHNIEVGDSISFEGSKGQSLSGTIKAAGKDGVTVEAGGQEYHVLWKDIRGYTPKAGAKKPGYNDRYYNKRKEYIEPENFTASEWKKQWDDSGASMDTVLNSFEDPGSIKKAIAETEERLKILEQTIAWHRREGKDDSAIYSPEREKLHEQIIEEILSPQKMINSKPLNGEKPRFIMLGGRGGSGKSWFKGNVYNADEAIVLDADEIKGKLPEYEGWNAQQVHEESSDILEKILARAREEGLNVVLDATMKTAASVMKKVQTFKDSGYQIEAHYMHLPRQEAAKRAVSRFMGKTKRYVPVEVVLSNTSNEDTFDMVKKMADKWSFRDNNVPQGQPPILISEGGSSDKK
jgi:predicted kinase